MTEKTKPAAAAVNPTKPMLGQDLAAFVAMLFWMHDPTQANYTYYSDFGKQVNGIQASITNGTLPNSRLFQNWQTINADPVISAKITNAQVAIGAMMQSLGGLWDGCSSVSMAQVAQIAKLP